MPFNSVQFLIFLPIVFLVYVLARDRWRWVILLTSSLIFYAALGTPHLLVALTVVTLSTYFFGRWMASAAPNQRQGIFCGGLIINALVLVVLKYIPFLVTNLNLILQGLAIAPPLKVPPEIASIGVSFYVFQAMAYLINVYLEIIPPEKHLGYFALYQSFFPKLLQGPIERPEALLAQFRKPFAFNDVNVRAGALLFAWGLFKKIVLADRLGFAVNSVYSNVSAYSGIELGFASIAFALQIFFDFSGYTDMALGVAQTFNIRLTNNFNHPYLARSIPEFWRRWHITFSSWILDYIFKPIQMGLRNWGKWGSVSALLVTFLISGIWHGAQWTFIVWGLLHGFYMAFSVFYTPIQKKIYKKLKLEKSFLAHAWQVLITFSLVTFAWIFFRATSLQEGWFVVSRIYYWLGSLARFFVKGLLVNPLRGQADFANFFQTMPNHFQLQLTAFTLKEEDWIIIAAALVVYILISYRGRKLKFFEKPFWFRWGAYYLLAGAILYGLWRNIVIYTDFYQNMQFLYFRF